MQFYIPILNELLNYSMLHDLLAESIAWFRDWETGFSNLS